MREIQHDELDREMKNLANRPWHSGRDNRAVETKNSDAEQGLLPSMGSAGHHLGRCKPCAFVGTKGCNSATECQFCHLCEPGEKQRRKKKKRAAVKAARQAQDAEENVQV